MNNIVKIAAVMNTVMAHSIAAAHVGSVGQDAYVHGAAHGLEILTVLLIAYLGYRGWRKLYR